MALYSLEAIQKLIAKYEKETNGNFELYTINGSLLDNYIITGEGLKTVIVKEKYLNCWSSCYTIRIYNTIPSKYAKVIDALENDAEGYATELFFK